jgi:hypothetical protein
MNMPLRPLGAVLEMIESIGHDVTYVYDDLVFIEHNAYLLQFGKTGDHLDLFFNMEVSDDDADTISENLIRSGRQKGFVIERKGHYELFPSQDENLQIRFFERSGTGREPGSVAG